MGQQKNHSRLANPTPPAGDRPSKRKTLSLGDGLCLDYPHPSNAAVSAVMQGNRKRDTRPELALRRTLYARGLRYRVHSVVSIGALRVRPDVIFPGAKVAVFVDGCFWHGCRLHGTRPRTNTDYWHAKIARNQARDARTTAALEASGWTVIRAWEHEAPGAVAMRVEHAVAARRAAAQRRASTRSR